MKFTMIGERPVEQHRSPNCKPRAGAAVQVIVLHATEGAYRGAITWLCNPAATGTPSAHFVVSRRGEIAQLVDTELAAFHAGQAVWNGNHRVNAISLGIEMEHIGDEDWPEAQVQAVADLCRALVAQYHLPEGRITSHAAVADPPGRKHDPAGFPWERFSAAYHV